MSYWKQHTQIIPNHQVLFFYLNVNSFSNGLAGVKKYNTKWGFINKTGAIQIEAIYDEVDSFDGGVARVRIGQNVVFVNKTGKFVQ